MASIKASVNNILHRIEDIWWNNKSTISNITSRIVAGGVGREWGQRHLLVYTYLAVFPPNGEVKMLQVYLYANSVNTAPNCASEF